MHYSFKFHGRSCKLSCGYCHVSCTKYKRIASNIVLCDYILLHCSLKCYELTNDCRDTLIRVINCHDSMIIVLVVM